MSDLPDRGRVEKAWAPFAAKYWEYLDEANWDSWFMQDKIVHAYMTGRLIDREKIDHKAAMRKAEELNCKAERYRLRHAKAANHPIDRALLDESVLRLVIDAALGLEDNDE